MKKIITGFSVMIILSILIYFSDLSTTGIEINSTNATDMNGHLAEFAGDVTENIVDQRFSLNSGDYTLLINYTVANTGNTIQVLNHGNPLFSNVLDPQFNTLSIPLHIDSPSSDITLKVNTGSVGYVCIDTISLTSNQRFYNDVYFTIFILWISFALVLFIIYLYKQELVTASSCRYLLLLFIISFVTSFPYLSGNFSYSGDDLLYHLSRIDGIKDGLLSGQFPVIINPTALNENGYLNSMYPSIFLYFSAILRLFGISLVTSYKALLVFIQFLTVFATSYSLKKMNLSKIAIWTGTILYLLLRYRVANIFTRAAVGETLALIFYPLILVGIYHILHGNYKEWPLLVLGMTGMLQSHILSFVLAIVLIVVLSITSVKCFLTDRERIFAFTKSILLTILINIWFIIPFLFYFFSSYINPSQLQGNYPKASLPLSYLFQLSVSDLTARPHSLGIGIVICFFMTIYFYITKSSTDKQNGFFKTLLIVSCILLFMSSTLFPSTILMTSPLCSKVLSFIQFPWRLVGPASFIIIFIFSNMLSKLSIKEYYKYIVSCALILLALSDMSIWGNRNIMDFVGYEMSDSDAYASSAHFDKIILPGNLTAQYPNEWRHPLSSSNESMQYGYHIDNVDTISVTSFQKNYGNIELTYTSSIDDSRIELPLIDYGCYKVVDENGSIMETSLSSSGRVLVSLINDGAEHQIITSYNFPIGFALGNIISLLTIVICVIYFIKNQMTHSKKEAQSLIRTQ